MTPGPTRLSRADVQALARSAGSLLPTERLDAVTATVNAVREVLAPLREVDFGEYLPAATYSARTEQDWGSDDAAP